MTVVVEHCPLVLCLPPKTDALLLGVLEGGVQTRLELDLGIESLKLLMQICVVSSKQASLSDPRIQNRELTATNLLYSLSTRHTPRIYPRFHLCAWIRLDHIWGIDAYIKTDKHARIDRFRPGF